MTTVIIELENGLLADYLHHYEVIIDGDAYGTISAGESFAVQLPPGEHAVKFRTAMLQSPVLKVFVGYNRTRIIGRANMWRAMGLFELFAPEDWVSIREEVGSVAGMMVHDAPLRTKQSRVAKTPPAQMMVGLKGSVQPHFAKAGHGRMHAV
jgi:hypothetical protein